MAKKTKKLPNTVYVTWNMEDEPYLSINEIPETAIDDIGDTVRVGVYQLQETVDVVNATKVKKLSK